MDSRVIGVVLPLILPRIFQLHVTDSGISSDKIHITSGLVKSFNSMLWILEGRGGRGRRGGSIRLSTPCYGFSHLLIISFADYIVRLSTPCYGFKDSVYYGVSLVYDMTFNSMLWIPSNRPATPRQPGVQTPNLLSTPCYGFRRRSTRASTQSPSTSFNSMLWILEYSPGPVAVMCRELSTPCYGFCTMGGCCSGLSCCNHLFLLSFPLP